MAFNGALLLSSREGEMVENFTPGKVDFETRREDGSNLLPLADFLRRHESRATAVENTFEDDTLDDIMTQFQHRHQQTGAGVA